MSEPISVAIADFVMRIQVDWEPARAGVLRSFSGYQTGDGAADLEVTIGGPARASYPHGPGQFGAVYGRFLTASWQLGEPVRVAIAPNLSPLRVVRPIVDLEGHPIREDVGRIVHERVVPSYVQLLRANDMCFVHGAAMADDSGRGLLISGLGGVGKTSLALELGRKYGWSFISDDMVLVDTTGRMHLNANRPKLYGYNVIGDADLEAQLLARDGWLGRLQWALRKRWPSHVRREIDPAELYPGTAASAPLTAMVLVERADVPTIQIEDIPVDRAADLSVQILQSELIKVTPAIESFLARSSSGLVHSWGPSIWSTTLRRGFQGAELMHVRVPMGMQAIPYRREMARVIEDITGGSPP